MMTNISNLDITNLDIISWIISPPFPKTFFIIKILFILISLYFLAGIIYFLSKTHYLQWLYGEPVTSLLTQRPYGVKKIDKQWKRIVERLKSDSEEEYKLAIIEADAILDEVLKKIGYKGDTIDERLEKVTTDAISNLEELKKVHQIESDIVRDPSYHLTKEEAKKILLVYKKTFEELDVI